jgi:DNA helicase II / ATP-dependent DNA helicase PcrA
VECLDGPLLVFAGAGSGKTRVLTARVAKLVAERRVWPDRLLAVTFTNRAAREMRERVSHLVEGAAVMWVGTFHATCVRMLRRDAERIGLNRDFTIFDEDDSRAALKRVLSDLALDPKKFPPAQLTGLISKAKNQLQTPDTYPNRSFRDEVVRRCFVGYEQLLRRSGGLDFDDLLSQTVQLLRTDPEPRDRWRDRFRYVLVDEYQDTNHAQYVMVNLLAEEHRQVAVVGDDDQSIYSWRGADVSNILSSFERDFPEAKVVRLEQNYRSTKPILDAAYHIIVRNPERAAKRLWTDQAGGELIHAAQLYNEVEEAEYVADEVERRRRVEGRKYSDFAVLYRINAQSRALEDVLARRRIPYRLVGGVRFWERAEVKDLLAYLRFIANPRDVVSFARLVNVPRRKIGTVSVEALVRRAREGGGSLVEIMATPEQVAGLPRAAQVPVRHLHEQLESVRAVIGALPPSELVQHVIDVMDLTSHYQDGTPQGDARLENLVEVKGLAQEFDQRAEPADALAQFLTDVALVSDVDTYDAEDEGVTLITLHMVKGLEFPIVFMVGMEMGLLPHQRAIDDPGELPEERRLCYVGMTRARQHLYLTCAFRRHLYGQSQPGAPSLFLNEIPASLLASPRRGAAPVSVPRRNGTQPRQRFSEAQVKERPPAPTVQRFSAGDRVRHRDFGPGKVLKSTLTRTDEELVVEFESCGMKILSATYAPLTVAHSADS